MSGKYLENPFYHDVPAIYIYIYYCDGTGHNGYVEEPYVYNEENL
jgi:hypothetical protein